MIRLQVANISQSQINRGTRETDAIRGGKRDSGHHGGNGGRKEGEKIVPRTSNDCAENRILKPQKRSN